MNNHLVFGLGMLFTILLFSMCYYKLDLPVDASLYASLMPCFVYLLIGFYKWAYETDKDY